MTAFKVIVSVCVLAGLPAGPALAVNMETVPVGNVSNPGEMSGPSTGVGGGADRICGAVAYTYNIGKYEVTASQYTEFLNAVAKTDTYGLYNTGMDTAVDARGCNIKRTGSSGSYVYSVASEWANRPVNYVSWGDAARFCNWMRNGQPTGDGDLDLSTTEDGSYYLYGMTFNVNLFIPPVTRKANATWVIPSEDEWYKAAYHKNDGVTANYFYYPTSSNSGPSNGLGNPTDPGNNATFRTATPEGYGIYTIGSPYWRTEVGAHENTESPYGTFDQGGNVWEWTEAILHDYPGSLRGGYYSGGSDNLHAACRNNGYLYGAGVERNDIGFRVVELPEPDSDGDGVLDIIDNCPNTVPGATVEANGCPPSIPGNFDRDGDVDATDFDAFDRCASGSAVTVSAGCEATDLDGDGDADQSDFAIFQVCYSGEGNPADPNCAPPPGMARIPAGEFQMGNSFPGEGDPDELPHAVYVDAFYIDRTEVTNQQYADALNWAKNQGNLITVTSGVVYKYDSGTSYPYLETTTSSSYSRITWDGSTFGVVSGKENHPMVMVTWYGSVAYANWRSGMQSKPLCYDLSAFNCNWGSGYRLPTEAEWEKAARGGVAGHRFPWSDSDDIEYARANYGGHPLWGAGDYPWTSPVGFFNGELRQKVDFNWPATQETYQTSDGANGYGLYDMAGNVEEWCNDWSGGSSYYSSSPYSNPRGRSNGSLMYRTLRGGDWYWGATQCRVADREWAGPSDSGGLGRFGFRLALASWSRRSIAQPTVCTTAVSNVTLATADSGGDVTNEGSAPVTARGVCWNMTGSPTTADSKTTNGTGAGSFTSSITGLILETTYYVRAYATNSVATAYGSEESFTTAATPLPPTVGTTAVSNVTHATADSGGDVTHEGSAQVFARGVCWNTTGSPTTADTKTSDGTGIGSFSSSITGLTPATTYYVRAYATNSVDTAYGSEEPFTTAAAPLPPGMVLIPAGEFQMGNSFDSSEGYPDELPRHAVYLDAFYMDRTEVTNQQYADALNWANNQGSLLTVTAGMVYNDSGASYLYCDTTTSTSHSRITWDGSTFGVVSGKGNHPMVMVTWYGAVAYANWRSAMQGKPLCYDLSTWNCSFGSGYRLPTEAEWEKAARGGASGHRFPWPDSGYIQHARANYYSSSSYSYDNSPTRGYHPLWGAGDYPWTSPMGFFNGELRQKVDFNWPATQETYQTSDGANGYGLYDMAGNVEEWCNDWNSESYYGSSPYGNPHGPTSGDHRLLRDGGWYWAANSSRVAARYWDAPDSRSSVWGFRCALGAP